MKNESSAQIVRQIVSSIFHIKATEVVLCEEIDPNSCWWDGNTGGGMWDNHREISVYGFNPKDGFVNLSHIVGREQQGRNDDPIYHVNEIPLYEVENVENYMFFIIHLINNYSDSNGQSSETDTWYLYKAADFKQYKQKIEEEDILRWEKWMNS